MSRRHRVDDAISSGEIQPQRINSFGERRIVVRLNTIVKANHKEVGAPGNEVKGFSLQTIFAI